MSSQILIVSGTHRSGTSLTADLLQRAGVHIGDRLLGPAAGNRRGHFEDVEFLALHQRSLARQGRDFLLESAEGLTGFDAAEKAEAERLVSERRARTLWGWKDPRTALFLDEWNRLLPEARWLFLYRHPLDVVLSLLRRATDLQIAADPMRGVRVWEVYNRAILSFIRVHRERCALLPLPMLAADPRAALARVGARLDVPLDLTAVGDVGDELHTGALPPQAAAVFAAFAPAAGALLAELDAEAAATMDAPPIGSPAAAAPARCDDAFLVFLARLDPAAVLAAREALAAFHLEIVADLEGRLRDAAHAHGELERLAADERDARAAAEARVSGLDARARGLDARVHELEGEVARLEAALASSPVRRLVREARRVSAGLWGPRPVPAPRPTDGPPREPMVLFVSHDAHRHGAQLLLLHFLRWLRAHSALRFEILLKGGGELSADFEAVAPTHHWPIDPAALASRGPVSLVYANTITNGDVLAALAPLACPVVTHVHELEHWIRHHVDPAHLHEVVRRTSRWIAVSRRVRDTLVGDLGIPAERIDLVYEFLGPELLEANDEATTHRIRRTLGVPDGAWLVGGSGTMDWRKGSDLFVQLAAAVARREPSRPVHFAWLGGSREGDAFAKLSHDARVAGVGDRVHFTGTVVDPARYTASFDVFALVSREDPFPLVALEAAAQRVPVVCFAGAGGAPELVDGACGYVVPYLDVEAMAERIVHLVRTPAERRAFGERGAARVRAEHTVEVAGPRLLAVIETLSSAGGARRAVR